MYKQKKKLKINYTGFREFPQKILLIYQIPFATKLSYIYVQMTRSLQFDLIFICS